MSISTHTNLESRTRTGETPESCSPVSALPFRRMGKRLAIHVFTLSVFGMLCFVGGCGDADDGNQGGAGGTGGVSDARGRNGHGGADGDPEGELVLLRPDRDARRRAERIHEAIPGTRLHFSQRTGQLMMVQGPNGIADAENPSPPKALALSRGTDEDAMAATLLDYFDRFADAYAIGAPAETLRLPKESLVGGPGPERNKADHLPSVHLTHTHQGLPVQGRFATGLFDSEGNLRTVLTRLLQIPEGLDPVPTLSEDDVIDAIFAQLPSIIDTDPALRWVHEGFEGAEHVKLLFWYPKTWAADSLVLAYEFEVRRGIETAYFIVDANTGDVLSAGATTPTEGYDDHEFERTPAPDEQGNMVTIPSSVTGGTRYLAFGANRTGARFFRSEQFLQIGDVSSASDRRTITFDPISITTEDENDWLSDPGYNTAHQFAATLLMKNLEDIMQWWADRGWPSWDGRGSRFIANVGTNKNDDGTPWLNAAGTSGYMQIGDALTPGGWYTSASAEVVGHEFMHNVIDATSDFRYRHESGALNEALADIFGVALTATGDRLSTPWIGDDAGWSLRNLRDPSVTGQPDRYSRYRVQERDNGGVHFNSGILNKAHYLVMSGATFNGIEVQAQGVEAAIEILRGANQLIEWDVDTSMEEFAAGVIGYCDLIDGLNRLLGNEGIRTTCDAFFRAYKAVELVQGAAGVDLAVESVEIDGSGLLEVVISNGGRVPVKPSDRFDLTIFDPLGGGITVDPPFEFRRELDPGDVRTIRTTVGADFLNPYTRTNTATITAELLPRGGIENPDVDMSNNAKRVEIGPDLLPSRLEWTSLPDAVEVTGKVINLGYTAYDDDVGAVVLVRDTATGTLSTIDALDVTLATDGGSPSRVDDTSRNGISFPATMTFPVDGGMEMPRNQISGTSRLPGAPSSSAVLQARFNDEGGLPELEGRYQVYLFLDPYDAVQETDETNNLLCVNCRRPGDIYGTPVVVFLNDEVDTDGMFPEPYRAAAAKLKSPRPFVRFPERFERERLSAYPVVEPAIPLP